MAALTYNATTYSAFMLVGLAGLTYAGGVGALGFELIYLSGLVLVAFLGRAFGWRAGGYDYLTPTEVLADRYQSKLLGVIAALAAVVFLIPSVQCSWLASPTLMEGFPAGNVPFYGQSCSGHRFAVTWAWMGGMRQ